MKVPTLTLRGNLRFTRSGTIWADYLIQGIPYGLRPPKEKALIRQLHQALFRSLGGEALLLGLASVADPRQIVEQMMSGLDPAQVPDWAAECEATIDTLEALHPGRRIYWLSIPLEDATPWESVSAMVSAARRQAEEYLALPRTSPSETKVAELSTRARKVLEGVPDTFGLQPATPAQMVWLHQHMLDRGLYQDWALPTKDHDDITPLIAMSKAGTAMPAPFLDEGGQTDDKKHRPTNPFARRYLKVADTGTIDPPASYQSLLVVTDTPEGAIPFPNGELIGRLDECGLDVDWAIRLRTKSSAEVMVQNKRALNALKEQIHQRENELSFAASSLSVYAEMQAEYTTIFEQDKLEIECQPTMIFAVAGPDPATAIAQARALTEWASQWGYRLTQPPGRQKTMWWAMMPGVPSDAFIRDYAQITTSEHLAALVPFASVHVGDAKGSVFGLNIGNGPMLDEGLPCGPTGVIFWDPDGATDRNESGSIAMCGDLGSGKSFGMKKVVGDLIDRGGRVVIPDRTEEAEWGRWAQALTTAVIVDVANPAYSLDPIRIWGTNKGSRLAQSFLTPLLNVAPTSNEGVVLSDVLNDDYLRAHRLGSIGAVAKHLADGCELAGAQELAGKLNVFARRDMARVIFDPDLPSVTLSDRAIIILTHSLDMPSQTELESAHLFNQMQLEKIFGRAIYALIAVLAKEVCFSNPGELAGFVVDEAHFVTSTQEGVRVLTDFVRDGRKHRAVAVIGSHDAQEDFPSAVMRGLIPNRVLLRHTDEVLAKRGLEWLGLDPADPDLVDLVTKGMSPRQGDQTPPYRRGEGLFRDAAGRVGRIKILGPAIPARNNAARTGGQNDRIAIGESSVA